jgi:hypothetical protein
MSIPKPVTIEKSFGWFFKFTGTTEDNGDVIVEGYASTDKLDDQGDIVTLDAIKDALPDYMKWANLREMHSNIAAGKVEDAHVDDKGLFIRARVVNPDSKDKVLKGVLKGFSIGGRKVLKAGKEIIRLVLNEISLVDRPANPECVLSFGKVSENPDDGSTEIQFGDFLLTIRKSGSNSPTNKDLPSTGDRQTARAGCATCGADREHCVCGSASSFPENHPPKETVMKADAVKKLQSQIDDLRKADDLSDSDKTLLTELETIAKGIGGRKADPAPNGNGDLADAIVKAIQSGNRQTTEQGAANERIIAAIQEVQKSSAVYAGKAVDGVTKAADCMEMACKEMDAADEEEGDGKDEEKRKNAAKMRKSAMTKMRDAFSKFSAAFGKLSLAKSSGDTIESEVSGEDFKKLSDDFDGMVKRLSLLTKFMLEMPDRPREEIVSELLKKEDDSKGNGQLTKVLAAMN